MDNSDTTQNQIPQQDGQSQSQPVLNSPWQTTTTTTVTPPMPMVPPTSPTIEDITPVSSSPIVSPIATTPVTVSPWQSTPVAGTEQTTPQMPNIAPSWQIPAQPIINSPSMPVIPPVTTAAPTGVSPWQSTPVAGTEQTTPQMSSTFTQTTTTTSVPAPTAPEAPLMTKKKGIPPVVMGVLTLFLIGGIAGGTFLMSRGVSSSQPISPNAPSSEPKAFDPSEEAATPAVVTPIPTGATQTTAVPSPTTPFDPNGTIDCSNRPNTAPFGNRCVATVTLPNGDVDWAPGALDSL